jgi:hypothetical protein
MNIERCEFSSMGVQLCIEVGKYWDTGAHAVKNQANHRKIAVKNLYFCRKYF